jgi:Cyclin, N-terminal domain
VRRGHDKCTLYAQPRQIRAIEKKAKKEQRQRLEIFFREMEANILSSLARGERIPLQTTSPKEGPPLEPLDSTTIINAQTAKHGAAIKSKGGDESISASATARVRTISGMNEHLLAQLQQPPQTLLSSYPHHPQPQPSSTTTTTTATRPVLLSSSPASNLEGRPPLPRPPPSSSTALHSAVTTAPSLLSATTGPATSAPHSSLLNSTYRSGSGPPLPVQPNLATTPTPLKDLDLSPEDDRSGRQALGEDSLRGEEFLDRVLVDLEVSDDEDETTVPLNLVAASGTIAITATAAAPATLTTISSTSASQTPDTTSSSCTASATTATTTTRSKADKNGLAPLSHIRRNTAGSVQHAKAGTTMDKPDIDGTIHVVCGVLRAHIEQSLYHQRDGGPSPNSVRVNLDIFRDDIEGNEPVRGQRRNNASSMSSAPQSNGKLHSIPNLEEIKAFYHEFYKRSQMEFDAIIMSLIYVERLIKETNGALMPTTDNWGSVVFSCMVLASKVWDDLSMWNIDFSNVSVNSSLLSSFSLKRINQLELAVLTCLNFAVTIPGSEYAKYYYLLRNMMIRGGLLDPFAANQPLSNDAQNRLEHRTNHYQECKLNRDDGTRRRVKSVDWSQLASTSSTSPTASSSTSSTMGQILAPESASSHFLRPDMVSGPVLREKLCLEQLAAATATTTAATSR